MWLGEPMRAVLKTNNPVQLNYAEVLLADANIHAFVFDADMSVMDGSVGILPRRLMVTEEDFEKALAILRDGMGNVPVEGDRS